jgi:serine/threonine protein kinase
MQLLYRSLLGKDYDVTVCVNGAQAVEEFRSNPADLMVLDINMPELTGLEVCETLRQISDVPILIVSANDDEAEIVDALALGANDYILKPFRPVELLAKITVALRRHKSERSSRPAVGECFAGRYNLLSEIGSGGFSTVYQAHDTNSSDDTPVAVKILDVPSNQQSAPFLVRFLREAYSQAKIDHQNVVRLLDFGQERGRYYLVMERVNGISLRQLMDDVGRVPEETVARVAFHMLNALRCLAEHDIIHRDIKPANIILNSAGGCKLLDFGLARPMTEDTLSADNTFRCTPHYASPEYIIGETAITTGSDVYSLGAALYHAASNSLPFSGNSVYGVLLKHVDSMPDPLDKAVPEFNPKLSELIERMLEKLPDKRPGPQELLDELGELYDFD